MLACDESRVSHLLVAGEHPRALRLQALQEGVAHLSISGARPQNAMQKEDGPRQKKKGTGETHHETVFDPYGGDGKGVSRLKSTHETGVVRELGNATRSRG